MFKPDGGLTALIAAEITNPETCVSMIRYRVRTPRTRDSGCVELI